MKEKVNPNHQKGKVTGYELINGEYHIAPLYQQQFDFLNSKEYGIKTVINGVVDHFAEDLAAIAKQRHEVFVELADDIGISLNDGWVYNSGILKPQSKQ
jgi:hypothetical protein